MGKQLVFGAYDVYSDELVSEIEAPSWAEAEPLFEACRKDHEGRELMFETLRLTESIRNRTADLDEELTTIRSELEDATVRLESLGLQYPRFQERISRVHAKTEDALGSMRDELFPTT